MADVRGLYWQAGGVVVCAGGVQNSGEAAFFAGVVLVQLGLCSKMIDDVLQFVREGNGETGHNAKGQRHTRQVVSEKRPTGHGHKNNRQCILLWGYCVVWESYLQCCVMSRRHMVVVGERATPQM